MEEQKTAHGGMLYVPQIAVQYVYLDFDGELTSYDGEILTVDNVEVKGSSLTEERIENIVTELNAKYTSQNVIFVTERPETAEYSTIYIGKTEAFSPYGNFAGLAETIDDSNENKSDNAFVMLDSTSSDEAIISTISHETDHLLGTLDHGGEGLNAYASALYYSDTYVTQGQVLSGKTFGNVHYSYGGPSIFVKSGGILSSTTFMRPSYRYEDGALHVEVSSGGKILDTTLQNTIGPWVFGIRILSGGYVSSVDVQSDQFPCFVAPGGKLLDVRTSSGFALHTSVAKNQNPQITGTDAVYGDFYISGNTAYNISLRGAIATIVYLGINSGSYGQIAGAKLVISSGAVASKTNILYFDSPSPALDVLAYGSAVDTNIEYGYLVLAKRNPNMFYQDYQNGNADRTSALALRTTVNSYGIVYVGDGAIANSTTVNNGCVHVFDDGVVNNTIKNGGLIYISSGGTANDTTVNNGSMFIFSGGMARTTTVNAKGYMYISNGGIANDITVTGGKHKGEVHISSGGFANNVIVKPGGYLYISSGGSANISFNPWSSYTGIFSSTGAHIEYLERDQNVYYGGSATTGGWGLISSGNIFNNLSIGDRQSAIIYEEGIINKATLEHSLASIHVSSGGVASNTIVDLGYMYVSEGATANSTYVNSGTMNIAGVARNTVVSSSGSVKVDSGAILEGSNSFAGSVVMAGTAYADGATLNFAVDQRKTTDSYIIDNLSLISGVPTYTVTVSVTQETGIYKIAAGASDFNGSITVKNTGGTNYGTLTVGNTITVNGVDYLLQKDNAGILSLEIFRDTTAPTLSNVTLTQGTGNYTFTANYTASDNKTAANNLTCQIKYAATQSGLNTATAVSGKSFTLSENDADKTYYYQVGVTDEAGNTTWSTAQSFTVNDMTKPTIKNVSLSQDSNNYTFTATVSATDNKTSTGNLAYEIKYASSQAGLYTAMPTYGKSFTLAETEAGKTYYYQVGVTDEAGNTTWSTAQSIVVKDTTAPTLGNVSLTQGADNYTFTANYTASDNKTAAGSLAYLIKYATTQSGLSTATARTGKSFSLSHLTANKVYYYQVGVSDETGNTTWSNIANFTVKDVTAPALNGTPTAVVNGQSVMISWNSASDNVGIAGYCLTVDGTEYAVSGTSYTLTDLSEGNHTFTLSAYDAAGNESSKSISKSFTIAEPADTVKPIISSVSIAQGANNYTFTATITASDNKTAANDLTYQIKYAATQSALTTATATSGKSFTLTNIAAGKTYYYQVGVTDEAGNTAWSDVKNTAVKDVTAPTLNGTPTAAVNGQSVTISWNAASDNLAIKGYYLTVDGNKYTVTGKTSYTLNDLSVGNHTFALSAYDAAGNESSKSASKSFTIAEPADTVKPTISIVSIAQGTSNYTFTATVSASDNKTATANLSYQIKWATTQSGLTTATATSGKSFTLNANAAGKTYYYQIGVTDEAGNTAWTAANGFAVKDVTAPTLNGTPTATVKDQSVTISWNAASDNLAVKGYYLTVDGNKYSVTGNSYTLNNLAVGNHTFALSAYDAAGNESSKSISKSFTIAEPTDTVKPIISSVSIAQGANNYTFTATITASDNKTAANDLTYQIKYATSTSWLNTVTATSGKSFTIANTAAGKTYYYQVGVTDEAGNTAWSTAESFYIEDKTTPVLNGTPTAAFANNAVTVSWNAASDNVGVAGYHLTINGTVYDVKGTSYTLSGVSAGTYTYQLSAYDAAGNETAKTASKSLEVESCPDLIVNSIKVLKDGSPVTTVSTEDKITVYINVKNIGDATSTANTVKVYCGEVLLKEVSLASIAKNATAVCTCTIEAGSMSTGVQDIYVQLDAKGTVTEYNEDNNEAHFSLLVENRELCDLVVGSIELDKTACSISESTKVSFTIKNIGYVTAGATKAYIYDGDTYLGSVNVASLAAGATSAKLSYTIPAGTLSAGSHSIRVVADGEGLALESNTNNNSASAALTVGGVDLSVSKLNLSKTSCNTGENLTVNFTIRNSGIDKSGAFKVGIYDGNTLLGTVDIANLDAGLSVAKTFVISAGKLSAGTHNIRVSADINNAVSEIDETNNSRSTSVNVSLLDTTAPTFKSTTITQGSENYTFTVKASATDNATAADQLVYKIRYAKTQAGLASAQAQSSMSFNLTADDAGDTWYYQVSATDKAGNTAWSAAKSFTVADKTDPVFGNISVTTTNMTLKLTWSATDNVGISTYKVYFDDELKATQATTSYTLSNVAEGVHTYRIEAFDAAGNMVSTGNTSVRFDDTIAPVIDNISIAQQQGTYKFIITPNVSDNITSTSNLTYKVQYAFTQSGVASATAVSGLQFTLDAAKAGKPVYYRINVADEAGNNVWSNIQSINVADVTNPGNITGLKDTINGTSVTLDWADSSDNVAVTGYYVRYGKSRTLTGNGTKVTDSQQTLSNLSTGEYFWQVRAVDAAGNLGEWSTVDNFTIFPADPYENNDTIATAYNLGTLNGEKTYTGGAIASASDADYFKFTIDSRGTANDYVQISFNNSVGDVDLYLYAANGSTLIKSANVSTSGTEKISLEGLTKGTYIIKAVGKNGAMNTYTLYTKKVAGYDPDIYDANSNNNTRTAATVFNIETTPQKTISNLNLHEAGDTDFYQFTLSNMGVAGDNVTINFQNSVGDLDLFLYNAAGSLVQKSEGNGNSETLNFSGMAAGTYYVQVKSPHNHVNEYSLSWKFTPNNIAADEYEGKEPIAITETTEIKNLTISAADTGVTQQDTFKITLAATGNNSSKITFSDFRSDWNGLKYTVKNSSNTTVLSGTGAEISLNGLAAGNYTVTVDTPVTGSYGEYSISVNMPEAEETKKWTYMVYMAADSNIEWCALYDIIAMQQADLDADIDIYVLADRSSNSRYHIPYGFYQTADGVYLTSNQNIADCHWGYDWTDTRVGKISHSTGNVVTVNWESWGEQDTSSISVLNRFVNWVQDESDAENYGLIMWDHGAENAELCWDYGDSNTAITISELSTVLEEKGNIPLVIFNNCLLGSEIVATQLAGTTDVIVASEPVSFGLGTTYAYKEFFSNINDDMSAAEMAEVIVQGVKQYEGGADPSMLSAINVRDKRLATALDNLSNAIKDAKNDYDQYALINGFANTIQVGCAYSGTYGYQSDLLATIILTRQNSFYQKTSSEFKTALANLEATLNQVIIDSKSMPANTGFGIAVFNPILTAKAYSLSGNSTNSIKTFLSNYISSCYGSNQAWGNLLWNLALTYQSDFYDSFSQPSSFGGMNFAGQNTDGTIAYSVDLGCFSGKGVIFENIGISGEQLFTITITDSSLSNGKIIIDGNGTAVYANLKDALGNIIVSGSSEVNFANLAHGTYTLCLSSSEFTSVKLEYDAIWTTGVDRFDYAKSHKNEKYANGNGSIAKSSFLSTGYHSGLVSYKGDSDWYQIGNIYTDDYMISVSGTGLTVAEYDAAGNLIQTAKYVNGKYTMMMQSMNYLYVEGDANIDNNEVNSYSIAVNSVIGTASVVIQTIENLTVDADKVSWESAANRFNAQLSKDGFENNLALSVDTTSISTYGMSNGNYQWRVQPDGSSEWTASESFAAVGNTQPQKFVASTDDSTDVFFANANGTWKAGYAAQHLGILNGWSGTSEQVTLTGRNKLADIFEGSSDANILVMTDDANGDALFVDDIYTALPGTVAEQQARIAQIDEIRAGAGDDLVDMTSQRFAYAGDGVKVYGGLGNDTIWANKGSNTLFGDAGNDRLVGASGNDVIVGGSGNDSMHGGGGEDIFAFGGAFGQDTVEQLAGGSVTLWFETGSESNWNALTMTYTDGVNSVTVSGSVNVTLRFGTDAALPAGAFADAASQKIFEDKDSGMLA